jgi:hypothetical protein
MKKLVLILAAFLLSTFAISAQDSANKKMSPGDSLTVSVKFERVKLSKEDVTAQELVSTLLANSAKTTEVLSESINRLTTAVEDGLTLSQQTKADIIANQLGITREQINKVYKRNGTILLLSLIPALMFVFYSLTLLFRKGLDIKSFISGTAMLGLYAFIGSAVFYAVLSLVFNQQYFVVKNLMNMLF